MNEDYHRYKVFNLKVVFNAVTYFGKYKGKKLQELPLDYQQWVVNTFNDGMFKKWIQICLRHGKYAPPLKDDSRC